MGNFLEEGRSLVNPAVLKAHLALNTVRVIIFHQLWGSFPRAQLSGCLICSQIFSLSPGLIVDQIFPVLTTASLVIRAEDFPCPQGFERMSLVIYRSGDFSFRGLI